MKLLLIFGILIHIRMFTSFSLLDDFSSNKLLLPTLG